MNLIINTYRESIINRVLSDPQNVGVVQLWIDNHPVEVSHSPKLQDLKNRVYHLNTSDIEMVLPLLFDKLSAEDLTALLSSSSLSEETIQRLSTIQILRLNALSNVAQNINIEELALYIEQHKISLNNIKLTGAELLRLAPHLRYVDLKNFTDIPLAKELLQKCSNLYVLLINNGEMLANVSSLPLCEKLDCSSCTNLRALPELPLCKILNCSGCTNLPGLPALPLCEMLYCYDCTNLGALPVLPLCKILNCDCTNLPALPPLPLCEKLFCYSCSNLPELPTLPLCTELYCQGCSNLRAIPEVPLCKVLHCIDCTNLTTLPLSLGQNAGLTSISITGTRIERTVRDAILDQCRQMRDAEAVTILPSCLAKWKAFAKSNAILDVTDLSDDQKITLNEWLLRLERTKDFVHSQTRLTTTVCNILADLLKNKEFQELFFPQAEANNACCEDRAAMSLNEIYTSWMLMCKSRDLQILTGVAKTLRLRKELQKLIRNEGESVEIFLYYESTLRERLGLETAIQNMTYGTIGKRDWINEDKLVEDVEAHFFEELFELPVFEKMIVFDDVEFSDKLEALGECPKGDLNDPQVLNYQHRQGEIMQEWKRKKKLVAKQWYDKVSAI